MASSNCAPNRRMSNRMPGPSNDTPCCEAYARARDRAEVAARDRPDSASEVSFCSVCAFCNASSPADVSDMSPGMSRTTTNNTASTTTNTSASRSASQLSARSSRRRSSFLGGWSCCSQGYDSSESEHELEPAPPVARPPQSVSADTSLTSARLDAPYSVEGAMLEMGEPLPAYAPPQYNPSRGNAPPQGRNNGDSRRK